MTRRTGHRSIPRVIDPLTAVGGLLALSAATALITYLALITPGQLAAANGPPEEFLIAATRQARQAQALQREEGGPTTVTPEGDAGIAGTPEAGGEERPAPTPPGGATVAPAVSGAPGRGSQPTPNPAGDWPLPEWVEVAYWLSIPALNLEAPIIALTPREVEENGVTVLRLPVPNSYSVAWDATSAEPGFPGNTILTGHNNLYGAVFGELHQLNYGAEIAVWSEYGVFSYYVSTIEYLEEKDQPFEVRYQNAQWLNDTPDDRLTLITCWPRSATHRLIIVATR